MWYLYGPWDFPNLNFDINILIVTVRLMPHNNDCSQTLYRVVIFLVMHVKIVISYIGLGE